MPEVLGQANKKCLKLGPVAPGLNDSAATVSSRRASAELVHKSHQADCCDQLVPPTANIHASSYRDRRAILDWFDISLLREVRLPLPCTGRPASSASPMSKDTPNGRTTFRRAICSILIPRQTLDGFGPSRLQLGLGHCLETARHSKRKRAALPLDAKRPHLLQTARPLLRSSAATRTVRQGKQLLCPGSSQQPD